MPSKQPAPLGSPTARAWLAFSIVAIIVLVIAVAFIRDPQPWLLAPLVGIAIVTLGVIYGTPVVISGFNSVVKTFGDAIAKVRTGPARTVRRASPRPPRKNTSAVTNTTYKKAHAKATISSSGP